MTSKFTLSNGSRVGRLSLKIIKVGDVEVDHAWRDGNGVTVLVVDLGSGHFLRLQELEQEELASLSQLYNWDPESLAAAKRRVDLCPRR